jgi:hypothetical protein
VETFTIILYGIVFYRYYSKRKLRKSMNLRDKARSDLYLAQLRTQTAPNTPGFGPLSPSYSAYMKSPRFPPSAYTSDPLSKAEDGFSGIEPGTRFIEAKPAFAQKPKPFALQAPPTKNPKTPQKTAFAVPPPAQQAVFAVPPPTQQAAFAAPPPAQQTAFSAPPPPAAYGSARETRTQPAPMAAGEKQYDAVPIPGAYVPASPPPKQQTFAFTGLPGQAVTAERRVDSPPLRRAGSR